MGHSLPDEPGRYRSFGAALWRALWLAALWAALAGLSLADLPAVIIAVALGTWACLRLLPPGRMRPSIPALSSLFLRFLWQSLVAGIDVAWRALSPSLPLNPGFVIYETRLPPGPARSAFLSLMSLLPGSLPAWQDAGGAILVHCLDTNQEVTTQMAEEEKLFVRALGLNDRYD